MIQPATSRASVASRDDDIVGRHAGRHFARAVLVSGLTLVSRILGFVREVLSASLFGDTSGVFDAFVTAWRIPNLFRRFLGEGALSTSLQTALTETDGDFGPRAGRALFQRTVRVTTGILVAVTVVASAVVAALPDRLPILGWEWLGAHPAAIRELTVRLLPFVVLACLAALFGGALQVRGRFGAAALAPALMNVVWIGALVVLVVRYGWGDASLAGAESVDARQLAMTRVLAWGVLAAGTAQLLVHVPALRKSGLVGGGREAGGEPERGRHGALEVLRRSAPLALGAAVYQVNVMVDGFMAEGLLRDGGPSAHYYANRVQQFPLAMIAIAATSAVFPALKALGHRGERGELRALHDRTQLFVAYLALPAAAALAILAEPMATVLFQHGAYGADGVARIAATLRMLALALLPAGAVGLAGRAFYAEGDFRTPVRVSIAMLALNVVLNAVFVAGLGMDADGLALATAAASWVQLALLLPLLRRRLGLSFSVERPGRRLAGMLACSVAAAGVALAAQLGVGHLAPSETTGVAGSAWGLAAAGACGMGAYAALTLGLGLPEGRALRDRLRARYGRRRGG